MKKKKINTRPQINKSNIDKKILELIHLGKTDMEIFTELFQTPYQSNMSNIKNVRLYN